MLAHDNYLLVFDGYKPKFGELEPLLQNLPKLDSSPIPSLSENLPASGLVPNSQRYVVGPVGLEDFYPGIPAGVAGFHLGSEAQIGTFHPDGGEMKLAIFSYPTPNIARERLAEMQKLPGAMAKRSGPLVAVILCLPMRTTLRGCSRKFGTRPRFPGASMYHPGRDNIGDLIVNAFTLIGVLLAFATVAGLAFGGLPDAGQAVEERRSGRHDGSASQRPVSVWLSLG